MPAAARETERVGLRLIAVNTEKEAASLQVQLQAGAAFEDLAKKYSTAPSAVEGGWLGLFQIAGLRAVHDFARLTIHSQNQWSRTGHALQHLGGNHSFEEVVLFEKHQAGVGSRNSRRIRL